MLLMRNTYVPIWIFRPAKMPATAATSAKAGHWAMPDNEAACVGDMPTSKSARIGPSSGGRPVIGVRRLAAINRIPTSNAVWLAVGRCDKVFITTFRSTISCECLNTTQ